MVESQKHPTIRCAACNMVSMLKGDIRGWKPVTVHGGRQVWFCDKPACQQQHDLYLAQSRAAFVIDTAKAESSPMELEGLRQRIVELEAENALLRRRLDGDSEVEIPESVRPPHITEQHQQSAQAPVSASAGIVHVDDGTGYALCGLEGAEPLKLPENLEFNEKPCEDCTNEWLARREGRSTATRKPVKESAHPSAVEAMSMPPEPALELAAPEPPAPVIDDYTKLPVFTPELIARINDGAKVPGPILMPPSAYPQIDLAKVKPRQLRNGVSAFFTGHRVSWIDRAVQDGQFLGIVFQLEMKEKV